MNDLTTADLERMLAERKAANKATAEAAMTGIVLAMLKTMPCHTFSTGSTGRYFRGTITIPGGPVKGYAVDMMIVDRDTVVKK